MGADTVVRLAYHYGDNFILTIILALVITIPVLIVSVKDMRLLPKFHFNDGGRDIALVRQSYYGPLGTNTSRS